MERADINRIKSQLIDRRERLHQAAKHPETGFKFMALLKEVDSALERMNDGTYGICVVCHDPIEEDRLAINPLINVCLDHLNENQRHALEADLDLARKIQNTMLPKNNLITPGWEYNYHYEPAGAVSGDYCDVIEYDGNSFFILGDVSGKGIAASLLMSHMHAMFHSLIPLGLGIASLVERVSRLLCESTLSSHYATLLFIKADESGNVEICNAGHPPTILIADNQIQKIGATGMPVGLFCDAVYTTTKLKLGKGHSLLLSSDGLTEAYLEDQEYGTDRVAKIALENYALSAKGIIDKLLLDVNGFIGKNPKKDDLTIMTIEKL